MKYVLIVVKYEKGTNSSKFNAKNIYNMIHY